MRNVLTFVPHIVGERLFTKIYEQESHLAVINFHIVVPGAVSRVVLSRHRISSENDVQRLTPLKAAMQLL